MAKCKALTGLAVKGLMNLEISNSIPLRVLHVGIYSAVLELTVKLDFCTLVIVRNMCSVPCVLRHSISLTH